LGGFIVRDNALKMSQCVFPLRIPTMPDMHSKLMSAARSDLKPAMVPI
jgi:hypothetical protein